MTCTEWIISLSGALATFERYGFSPFLQPSDFLPFCRRNYLMSFAQYGLLWTKWALPRVDSLLYCGPNELCLVWTLSFPVDQMSFAYCGLSPSLWTKWALPSVDSLLPSLWTKWALPNVDSLLPCGPNELCLVWTLSFPVDQMSFA